jgi:hypothetical protein
LAILAAAGVVVASGFGALAMTTSQGNDAQPSEQRISPTPVETTDQNGMVTTITPDPSTAWKTKTNTQTDTKTQVNTKTDTKTRTDFRTKTNTQTQTNTNTVTRTVVPPPQTVTETKTLPPDTVTVTEKPPAG